MKGTKNYLKYFRIELWELILIIVSITLSEGEGIKGFTDISFDRRYSTYSGNFLLENTSEKTFVFYLLETPLIGQKWNVSISLLSNSTSGINCSVSSEWANIWEGPIQFGVQIRENLSVQYVLHACGDFYDQFVLKFYFKFNNSSAYAQGAYSAKIHFFGYASPPECGTGRTYISNITEWLNLTSNITNQYPCSVGGDISLLGLLILLVHRRRRDSLFRKKRID